MKSVEYTATQKSNGECSHNDFYGQFVTHQMKCVVISKIGHSAVVNSKDPHFNDIPLKQWDALSSAMCQLLDSYKWKRLHNTTYEERDKWKFIWSLCSGVCIAKQAARMIKEEALQNETI